MCNLVSYEHSSQYSRYTAGAQCSLDLVTLKVFEDNVLAREFLEEKGNGRVLVVDGGGSLRCAILGGNPAVQAQNNGWAGIVVNGCIRDVDEINGCDIGVKALASHPVKANKKGIGEKHVPVYIAGTRIFDGEWLYGGTDGILLFWFPKWSCLFENIYELDLRSNIVSYQGGIVCLLLMGLCVLYLLHSCTVRSVPHAS
ncbi:4-hydroxy-4-methyl-2-oxoglutarate aldolase [Forsythia ovata]|uniref:4-hydroxy-4-methyl-2-oxoglutarate aldolase n=1 Tax=Forsythia ovata TaxID=205694 RepID=A0ABD1WL34_9LAMI